MNSFWMLLRRKLILCGCLPTIGKALRCLGEVRKKGTTNSSRDEEWREISASSQTNGRCYKTVTSRLGTMSENWSNFEKPKTSLTAARSTHSICARRPHRDQHRWHCSLATNTRINKHECALGET